MGFTSVLGYAQQWVAKKCTTGDVVIDGTAGNGVDTLFLAKLVGNRGQVYSFDIQEEALQLTRQRLAAADALHEGIHLIHSCHSQIRSLIPQALHGRVKAAMFNFGYLPGGDTSIITTSSTSVPALEGSLQVLQEGGIVTAILYPGHEGGESEARAIEDWAGQLPSAQAQVLCYRFINTAKPSPYLIAIEKRGS